MRNHKFLLLSLFLFTLTLPSCMITKVRIDYDPDAKFDEYTRFRICEDDLGASTGAKFDTPELRKQIGEAIKKELINRGYKEETKIAQLQAGFEIVNKEREVFVTHCERSVPFSHWPHCWIENYKFEEGTLVLHVTDLATNQVIWEGMATKFAADDELKIEVPKIVTRIYKKYPLEN